MQTHGLTRDEIKKFLGKDLEEFSPEQQEIMLGIPRKIKTRSRQQLSELEDDEPTVLF